MAFVLFVRQFTLNTNEDHNLIKIKVIQLQSWGLLELDKIITYNNFSLSILCLQESWKLSKEKKQIPPWHVCSLNSILYSQYKQEKTRRRKKVYMACCLSFFTITSLNITQKEFSSHLTCYNKIIFILILANIKTRATHVCFYCFIPLKSCILVCSTRERTFNRINE